ncbi:E3 ubiquitin-protein ligase HOS1-like, partial [Trifolium medium]|nr:E3 ubiquitin-protein ligase HOS1-like [Trifolium medium]
GSPDTALMVLRWSGRDGGLQMNSLRDAVTAVRVRIECGLLTEAFMHQRVLCTKAKEKTFNKGLDLLPLYSEKLGGPNARIAVEF